MTGEFEMHFFLRSYMCFKICFEFILKWSSTTTSDWYDRDANTALFDRKSCTGCPNSYVLDKIKAFLFPITKKSVFLLFDRESKTVRIIPRGKVTLIWRDFWSCNVLCPKYNIYDVEITQIYLIFYLFLLSLVIRYLVMTSKNDGDVPWQYKVWRTKFAEKCRIKVFHL